MAHTIIFDTDHGMHATRNLEIKFKRINNVELYANSLLANKGYVYLNTIYEQLGLEWDPLWENICYIYDVDDPRWLVFDVNMFEVDKPLTITICH
jgi:hypothetical protein